MARARKRRNDALGRALKERDEARAFQAATDEILTAISRSTSDAKPVFDAIVRSVPRLFGTRYVAVFLVKGDEFHLAAAKADADFEKRRAAVLRRFRDSFPQRIDWRGFTGKALRSGKVSQIAPIIGNAKATPQAVELAKEFGYNAMLVAPLMRDGKAIGAIGTTRPEAKLFGARELALFKAFAAQAVIAIENARLFNETKEALEQQTATAEILKVISASPTSTQPVFESIVNNCGVLFKDSRVALWQISEGRLLPRASTGYMPEPMPLDRESAIGACVLEARTIHFADLRSGAERHPRIKQLGLKHGYLSGVYAPLLREGQAIGAISVLRRELGAFSDKEVALLGTFADQAVIAIENARLFNETKEALEQQTTTAGVLRVIAGSPSDLKPVMNAVVEKAARLLEADHALIGQADGEGIHWLAAYGCPVPDGTRSITRELPSGRAILDLQTTQIEDIGEIDRDSLLERSYGQFGVRTICATPLIREGRAVGVILLRRTQVRSFTEKQMSLLRTFADQAVIAIENARLFNETKEALEQQTASSDILRVISRTPGDIQPVLEAIVQNALRLCGASFGGVWSFDGALFRRMHAIFPPTSPPEFVDRLTMDPIHPGPETPLRRVAIDKAPVHTADLLNDPAFSPPPHYRREGMRAALAVPMLKDGALIGALAFHRYEPKPFTDKQIALVQAFASQAVIAIENSRLFGELTSTNASLRDTLEQQTSTAEILRVISGTPTETQPVFDAIVQSAQRLMSGKSAALILRRESEFLVAAFSAPGLQQAPADVRTVPLDREKNFPSRVILDGEVVHIPDWEADEVPEHERAVAKALGFASGLQVPLLREGQGIGALVVTRQAKGRFQENEIALLRSFADQAVIAIENVRLFNETKEALERQTAIAEILKVMSASPSDVQPVFDAVAVNAARVCGVDDVAILRSEGADLRRVAHYGSVPVSPDSLVPVPPGSVNERVLSERRTLHVPDTAAPSFAREFPGSQFPAMGVRALLATPLVHDGVAIGVIHLRRAEPRRFTGKQIELLETFAAQAVIAIENTRLFNETKEALEQQTASAAVLRVIGSSPAELPPVFDSILENAMRLCDASLATVGLYDGKLYRHVAQRGGSPEYVKFLFGGPFEPNPQYTLGRMIAERQPFHAPDYRELPAYKEGNPRSVATVELGGTRTYLAVPMLKEGQVVGGITVRRTEVRQFTQKQIDLVRTFADQAVIAIENTRLFNETREALEQQTAMAEVLQVISASVADTAPVFDKILQSCKRLFSSAEHGILLVAGDGRVRIAAHHGSASERVTELVAAGLADGLVQVEAIRQRKALHFVDALADEARGPVQRVAQRLGIGSYSQVVAPMLWEDQPVGWLYAIRQPATGFKEAEIALLKAFADQAVIAIQNSRLFNETKEALERQMATGEILASISGSMTDTKPVFDAIVRNLLRLFGTGYAVVSLRRGEVFELGGFRGEPGFERLQDAYPMPVDGNTIIGEVLIEQRVAKYAPIAGNPAVPGRTAEIAQRFGFNSVMAAPMMWKGEAIGVILTARRQALPFDDKQVALIQSFADQAVIAIENVRLFKELQERTEALTKSVNQLTALGEVGQAISSTLELDEVLRTIVQRAVQLAGLDGGSIYEFDEGDGRFHLRAAQNVAEDILAVSRASPIRLGEGALGRAGATREPVVVEDVLDASYRSRARELLIKSGARALLSVPLLREDHLLGALVVSRKSPGAFAPEAIELLKTFATQSAVAIQNARLFREIEDKSRQLEEASRHKSQFLASMSHELRTPLNAILGFNEMILGQIYGEVPSDMKEPLEDIQKSGKHLLRLINNVLDLAKIEAGKMELSLADYSVHDTVESVRSTLRPLAEAKGLELVVSVPEDIPLAYGDGGRLTQCLMNLAGNSLKFTKEGRVEIAVEAENGCLRWRVSDTGIGIPPDKISTLFSEFKQTDATIASEYGGTGLGLSITKKFVEMHGGRIWVESELGKGSVFTLEIPLRVTTPA